MEKIRMYDSQGYVFTNEFDDLRIVISLDMGVPSAYMQVTVSEPDGFWNELVPISVDNLQHTEAR